MFHCGVTVHIYIYIYIYIRTCIFEEMHLEDVVGQIQCIDNVHRDASMENRSMLSCAYCSLYFFLAGANKSIYWFTSLTLKHNLGTYHQKCKTKYALVGNSCLDLKLAVDRITLGQVINHSELFSFKLPFFY
jgi:hypothetical protein